MDTDYNQNVLSMATAPTRFEDILTQPQQIQVENVLSLFENTPTKMLSIITVQLCWSNFETLLREG